MLSLSAAFHPHFSWPSRFACLGSAVQIHIYRRSRNDSCPTQHGLYNRLVLGTSAVCSVRGRTYVCTNREHVRAGVRVCVRVPVPCTYTEVFGTAQGTRCDLCQALASAMSKRRGKRKRLACELDELVREAKRASNSSCKCNCWMVIQLCTNFSSLS